MIRVKSYAAAGLFLLTATGAFPQELDCLKTGNLAEFAALTTGEADVVKHTSEFRLSVRRLRPNNVEV